MSFVRVVGILAHVLKGIRSAEGCVDSLQPVLVATTLCNLKQSNIRARPLSTSRSSLETGDIATTWDKKRRRIPGDDLTAKRCLQNLKPHQPQIGQVNASSLRSNQMKPCSVMGCGGATSGEVVTTTLFGQRLRRI